MSITIKPNDELMRPADVAEYLHISISTLYRIIETDKAFPAKRKLSKRTVVYLKSEISDWVNNTHPS